MSEFGRRLDGPGGRRAAGREPVLLTAAMLAVGASRSVTVLDVSQSGLKIEANVPLKIGQDLWLKVPPYDIFGTVVWIDGKQCGVQLDEPFTEAQAQLLQTTGRIVRMPRLSQDEQLALANWRAGSVR